LIPRHGAKRRIRTVAKMDMNFSQVKREALPRDHAQEKGQIEMTIR
jgi:hypothetical protein